jgi:hypothetical protein
MENFISLLLRPLGRLKKLAKSNTIKIFFPWNLCGTFSGQGSRNRKSHFQTFIGFPKVQLHCAVKITEQQRQKKIRRNPKEIHLCVCGWFHVTSKQKIPLTCSENSYREGSSWATAPTASSATFIQSASDNDTIRGVRHAHSPASVISLQPASSSSKSAWNNNTRKLKNIE